MTENTIVVLNPTAVSKRKGIDMAIRPENLGGKVLGLIWNNKPGANLLLDEFVKELEKRFQLATVVQHRKPSPAVAIDEDSLNKISLRSDFVIAALAD